MSRSVEASGNRSSTRASLGAIGITAMCLGFGVFWAQGPGRGASLDQDASWARDVESGSEHITPTQLVEALLAHPADYVLVDVRPTSEFAAFHLPGAFSLDLPALLGAEGKDLLEQSGDRTIVLYSNGMVHPAQAWVDLVGRGHANIRVLEGGLNQLRADVLTPPSLRSGYDEARARRESAAYLAARELIFSPSVAEFESYATDPSTLTDPTVVSTAWVAERGLGITLIDARDDREAFLEGHLAGAIHLSVADTRRRVREVERVLPPAELAQLLGDAGITEADEIVVYADEKLHDATYLLLALRTLGHGRMALMEGGFGTWKAEGRETTAAATARDRANYQPPGDPPGPIIDLVAGLDDVIEASRGSDTLLVDGRPSEQFTGEKETREPRAGHVPRALDRPIEEDVARVKGGVFFRPRAEVLAGYEALGVGTETPMIAMCRTGHQASQTWFLLGVLIGNRQVRWYDGSWQEWARRETLPVGLGPAME